MTYPIKKKRFNRDLKTTLELSSDCFCATQLFNSSCVRRREITALQAENYSLERQLFSYQKSLAYAQAQAGAEPAAAEREAETEAARRSPAERSLSTDTEYA